MENNLTPVPPPTLKEEFKETRRVINRATKTNEELIQMLRKNRKQNYVILFFLVLVSVLITYHLILHHL